MGQPHLGGERLARGRELGLAVDQEGHLLDAVAGDDGVGPPEPDQDVVGGRQEQQAVGAGSRLQRHQLAGFRGQGGDLRLGDRIERHAEAARDVDLGAAGVVLDLQPHHEARLRAQAAVDRQHHRLARGGHRLLEAHPELVERLARLLDHPFDGELDRGSLVRGGLEAGVQRQPHQEAGEDALAVALGEVHLGRGDLELRHGRRHLAGRRLASPSRRAPWAAPGSWSSRADGRPCFRRAKAPVRPGMPVASSTSFACLQVWRSKRTAPIWLCSSSHCWSQYSISGV